MRVWLFGERGKAIGVKPVAAGSASTTAKMHVLPASALVEHELGTSAVVLYRRATGLGVCSPAGAHVAI
jgi:hypothetical protein